jgi:hypothetical protein
LQRGVDVSRTLAPEIRVSRIGEAGEDRLVMGAVDVAGDIERGVMPFDPAAVPVDPDLVGGIEGEEAVLY